MIVSRSRTMHPQPPPLAIDGTVLRVKELNLILKIPIKLIFTMNLIFYRSNEKLQLILGKSLANSRSYSKTVKAIVATLNIV